MVMRGGGGELTPHCTRVCTETLGHAHSQPSILQHPEPWPCCGLRKEGSGAEQGLWVQKG